MEHLISSQCSMRIYRLLSAECNYCGCMCWLLIVNMLGCSTTTMILLLSHCRRECHLIKWFNGNAQNTIQIEQRDIIKNLEFCIDVTRSVKWIDQKNGRVCVWVFLASRSSDRLCRYARAHSHFRGASRRKVREQGKLANNLIECDIKRDHSLISVANGKSDRTKKRCNRWLTLFLQPIEIKWGPLFFQGLPKFTISSYALENSRCNGCSTCFVNICRHKCFRFIC